jgi:secondary thiamine-phosphate synthase enzyme
MHPTLQRVRNKRGEHIVIVKSTTVTISTRGRGTYDVSGIIQNFVASMGPAAGLCHVFVQHTSASLILCENADPSVRGDLETVFSRLAPDGDEAYHHTSEGVDDMSAHIRSILTLPEITLPVEKGRLVLGTWQGLYLWEHRQAPHDRRIVLTFLGSLP